MICFHPCNRVLRTIDLEKLMFLLIRQNMTQVKKWYLVRDWYDGNFKALNNAYNQFKIINK